MNRALYPPDIRSFDLDKLTQELVALEEKAFRARQIYEWIWKKSATSFMEMTNLSLSLRKRLEERFRFYPVRIDQRQESSDGTVKMAFRLFDDHLIEGVLIPADNRLTACISSQVGCSLSCKFCATGYLERQRNLTAAEIYDQVVLINREALAQFGSPLTNIVFMGMGEPLLNYRNVLQGIEHLTSPEGLDMAPRRITVSTAGIARMIKQLADDSVKFRLALSLHAANDRKRNAIMAINETNTLKKLLESLQYFYEKTKTRITFEYIVFHHFNDSLEDARELLAFSRKVPSKVNLIEYNPIEHADFTNPEEDKLEAFRDFLENHGVNVRLRRSRGKDIDAACGQLANKGKEG